MIFELRPSTNVIVILVVAASPLLVAGLLGLLMWIEPLLAFGLVLIGLWVVLSVATIRVRVSRDCIERRVFWRISWNVKPEDAEFQQGFGGDLRTMPAIVFRDAVNGQKLGQVLKPQFRQVDLDRFIKALLAAGATGTS